MEMSRIEHILRYGLGEVSTLPPNLSRVEELLARLIEGGISPDTKIVTIGGRVDTVSELPQTAAEGTLYFVGYASDASKAEYVMTSSGEWELLGFQTLVVDSSLSSTSLNPVENRAIHVALGNKVDTVQGKQLSTEDYTTAEKNKLAGIETGANKTTVDDTLNSESTNPVQNKTVYNKLSSIDAEIATIKEKFAKVELYGIKVEKNNSNPETRCTYMYDAVGFTPAGMQYNDSDIEASTFSYGSWGDAFFVKNNYPVMCNYDGSEDYKLSPSNHAYKEDGETASDISDTAYTGNAMSCFDCKIWIKMWEDDNFEYYAVSNYQLDEDYKDYPYIRADGTHADKLYYPMFKGSNVGSKLRSIAGTYPQNKTTAPTEVTLCSANGTNWQIGDWAHRTWLNVLLLLMGKNDNTQLVYGEGCTSDGVDNASKNYGFPVNGSLMDKGQFYGYATAKSTTKAMKVFYIENWWGTRWDRCLGLWNATGTYKIKWTPTYSVSAPDEDCLVMSGVTIPTSGFQKTMSNTYGRLCVTTGGSASTYTCDYYYTNNDATCLAIAGGNAWAGSYAGAWYVTVSNAPSSSRWDIGASPYLKQPS